MADPVENTNTLSDAERAAVTSLVSEAMTNKMEDTARSVYTQLVTANNIEVGDDLSPRWATDTARFLNAFSAKHEGEFEKAQNFMRKYDESRKGLSESAKSYENREAMRIIRDSKLSKEQQMRVLNTVTGSEGGFLLPKPFLAEVFVTLEAFGVARRTFRGVPMASKTLDLKTVAAKPVVNWENENAKIQSTDIEFGDPQLVAKKLAALLPWTMELQEDEVFGVISLASQLFGEAIAQKEDQAGFIGAGSSDTANGGFTGMLNLANAEVTALAGTTFASVTADDLSRAKYSISQAKRRNARWFMHDSIYAIIERLKDLEGAYIYRQPSAPGGVGTIWGDPVEFVDVMPSTTGANTRFIAYGDPSNMLFGNRRGVTFDIGREGTIIGAADATTAYSAFQQDGAILRVTERIGFATPLGANFAVIRTATGG